MKWTQIDVVGPEAIEEMAIACLVSAGCSGVQVIRQEDLPEYDQHWGVPEPSPRGTPGVISALDVIVRGFLPEGDDPGPAVREAMAASAFPESAAAETEVVVTTIEDPGWSHSWRQYFKPTRVGKRIVIVPSWEKYRPRKNDLVLSLDPGMAFGTGQHATTRLCLQALEGAIQPGMKVLDVGCGSGILSIAAVKLGAAHVLALDPDCVAVATTKTNVEINGAASKITIRQGTLAAVDTSAEAGSPASDITCPPVDLVVANILAPIIIDLIPAVLSCLVGSPVPAVGVVAGKPLSAGDKNGLFIASGIVRSQEKDVRAAMERHGMRVVQSATDGEWICITARPSNLPNYGK